ncbi:MAG TPA: heat-inducible transcriptional repressor HrcA [Anaerovoracaceae bacterium]|nr:heat-inducible transcriptional repressor HrcA [Anaerovoracaceae bacterium]
MELSERKLKILQVIISDYVTCAEPVGSRSIAKKYDLGISPATIRNEMSDLEEMGYLTHPHTSAGRVPSDKAYRLYVNTLMMKTKLTKLEKNIIAEKLKTDVSEFEKRIQEAASVLSEITNLTSFALTPKHEEEVLKFIKLLPVDEKSVIMMIVSTQGKVTNTALKLDETYNSDSLELLSKNMTYNYQGRTITEVVKDSIIKDVHSDIGVMSSLADNVMPNFMKTLEDMLNVNLYMEGLTNIFNIPEYNDLEKAKRFLEMLDKKEELTKKMLEREDGMIVTIGDENCDENMKDCTVITATYHIDGKPVGKIGVIGPTRMKYAEVTSIMEYLSENLSSAFQLEYKEGEDKKDE